MSTRKGSKGFLFGALAGGVLGSIAALLFAPKAGKELRQDISVQAQKVGDKTGEIAKGIGNGAIGLADRTKHAAGNVARNVRSFGRGRTAEFATISSAAAEASEELSTVGVDRAEGTADQLAHISEGAYGSAADATATAVDVLEETLEQGANGSEEALADASDAVLKTFDEIGAHTAAGEESEFAKKQ